jgi:hypothetical protein
MTDKLISQTKGNEVKTLEEALGTFQLVKGSSGSEASHQACETSLLNWIYTGTVSDTLECAHPFIRSMMIAHNDSDETTGEQRIEAVRLGMDGALDTWWVPIEVILSYFGAFTREESPTRHERLVKMLEGVAAWKENKVRANLVGANLDGANLDGANLVRAKLVGANLVRASLVRANLYGANLYGASLVRANLYGANLVRASLVRANLVGANLDGADLNGANLVRAKLVGASLVRASLRRANLDGADLDGANLDGASLDGASLVRASLVGANLDGADLNGANLVRALNLGFARHLDKVTGEPASLPDGWEFKNGLIVEGVAE